MLPPPSFRGPSVAREPGIHKPIRGYGFRARACDAPRNDAGGSMNILSIQSHVAYGHVGNAAATFPLQRIGVEVWPVHTVQFSNHPGYGDWTGRVFEAGLITELVDGIAARGGLPKCDGVLSGYLGSPDPGAAILD